MRRVVVVLALLIAVGLVAVVATVSVGPMVGRDPSRATMADDSASGAPVRRRGTGPALEIVTGRVMISGRPAVGHRVWVDGIETTTDEEGWYRVPDLPRGRHRVVAGGGEFLAEDVVTTPGRPAPRIALDRPRSREGVLELPRGVPREGVEIAFRLRHGDVEQTVTTDEDGHFHADRLRRYGHYVVMPSQRIGDRAFYRVSTLAGRFSNTPVRLEPVDGDVITGIVLAPDGRPVDGARVQARGKWPGLTKRHLASRTSGNDGTFELIVPAGVEVQLIATAPDPAGNGDRFAMASRANVAPPVDGFELRMKEGNTVRGIVLGPGGSAVAGAWLELRCLRPGWSWVPVVKARTDRRGRFTAHGLFDTNLRVRLAYEEAKSRGLILHAEVVAPSDGVEVTAVAALPLRGRIVRPPGLQGQHISYGFSRNGGRVDAWRVLRGDGGFVVPRRPAGTYEVHVLIGKDDRRSCGTIEAGAEPLDLTIPDE